MPCGWFVCLFQEKNPFFRSSRLVTNKKSTKNKLHKYFGYSLHSECLLVTFLSSNQQRQHIYIAIDKIFFLEPIKVYSLDTVNRIGPANYLLKLNCGNSLQRKNNSKKAA